MSFLRPQCKIAVKKNRYVHPIYVPLLMSLGSGGACDGGVVGINKFCDQKLHFENAFTESVPVCGEYLIACFICFTEKFSVLRRTEISFMKCTYRRFCTPHYRKFLRKASLFHLLYVNSHHKVVFDLRKYIYAFFLA